MLQRRPSNLSAGQSQQGYGNHGPSSMQPQWGPRGSNPHIHSQTQTMNNPHNYPHGSGGSAYPPQHNMQQYSQQSYNTGVNYTQPPPSNPAGYEYNGQGTQLPPNNYNQHQAASGGYPYSQTTPQQSYSGYNNQPTAQQMYGQQQQGTPQTGYAQQQPPQSYGGPPQQSYPMAQSGPTGYNQQPPITGYPQPNSQVNPSYGQGGYSQPGAVQSSVGYGQYPAAAVPTSNVNANYGYQGGVPDGFGYPAPAPNTGYGQAAAAAGYVQQPVMNPVASYDQSTATQVGYAAAPQAGYANKGASPQPGTGYGAQYGSAPQMY